MEDLRENACYFAINPRYYSAKILEPSKILKPSLNQHRKQITAYYGTSQLLFWRQRKMIIPHLKVNATIRH